MNNIILVGMPGCGKSTVGVILAKTLGMSFTDTDLIICAENHSTLQDIIEEKGLEHFGKTECETGKNLSVEDTVVATGGSMILYEEAMESLKKKGVVVYIKVGLDEIKRRLTNISTRGITFEKGETLDDIFNHRTPLYEKYADITVDADLFTIEETVTRLATILKENNA